MVTHRLRKALPTALIASTLGLGALLSSSPAFAQYDFTVVMNGLNNPRGLAFGPDGSLYVTEAGSGGNGPSIPGGEGPVSYGASSSVSRLFGGVQSRVLLGAPSLASSTGGGASGLQDIAFVGNQAYGIIGLGADPAARSAFSGQGGYSNLFGHLVSLSLDGSNTITSIADVAGYEGTNNPDGADPATGGVDSNPYSFIALSGGGFAVTDAGGNSLLGVTAGGSVSTLSVLPPAPNPLPFGPPVYQGVPTGIALGPDGSYYFTQLTGFPFPPGGANIYRYDPLTGIRTTAYTGFTNLTDLAFGPDGSLYALQLNTNSLLAGPVNNPSVIVKIDANGNRTSITDSSLNSATGIAIGSDGAIYVSNNSNASGTGQVVRITAAPEPGSFALLASGGLLTLAGLAKGGIRRRRRSMR